MAILCHALPRLPHVYGQAEEEAHAKQRSGPGIGSGLDAPAAEAGAAKIGASAAEVAAGAAGVGNGVGIQRHYPSLREGSAAQDCGAGIHGDASKRENVSCEGGACTESRRAADIPKHAVICTAIDNDNSRTACGCEGAPNLENEKRIRVAQGVESERSRQLSRRREHIDAGSERTHRTQILTSQVASEWQKGERIVRSRDVNLSLLRDGISLV